LKVPSRESFHRTDERGRSYWISRLAGLEHLLEDICRIVSTMVLNHLREPSTNIHVSGTAVDDAAADELEVEAALFMNEVADLSELVFEADIDCDGDDMTKDSALLICPKIFQKRSKTLILHRKRLRICTTVHNLDYWA
jgi:hypothetical protein